MKQEHKISETNNEQFLLKCFINRNIKYFDIFNERAGILEYEVNLSREEAERNSFNEIVLLYAKSNNLDVANKTVNDFIISFMATVNFNN